MSPLFCLTGADSLDRFGAAGQVQSDAAAATPGNGYVSGADQFVQKTRAVKEDLTALKVSAMVANRFARELPIGEIELDIATLPVPDFGPDDIIGANKGAVPVWQGADLDQGAIGIVMFGQASVPGIRRFTPARSAGVCTSSSSRV